MTVALVACGFAFVLLATLFVISLCGAAAAGDEQAEGRWAGWLEREPSLRAEATRRSPTSCGARDVALADTTRRATGRYRNLTPPGLPVPPFLSQN